MGLPSSTTIIQSINFQHQSGFLAAFSPRMVQPPAVLILGVLGFDNNLSELAPEVIESFRLGTEFNPDVQATLLLDRLGDQNSEVVEINAGVVTYTHVLPWLPGKYEVDMSDPEVLAGFLQWTRIAYPSTKTLVTFMGAWHRPGS